MKAYFDEFKFATVKTFYPSKRFDWTDQGNHYGLLTTSSRIGSRKCKDLMNTKCYYPKHHNLALLHLKLALPFQWNRDNLLRAAKAYGYTPTTNCTQLQNGKHGKHYCLQITEMEKHPEGSPFANRTQHCIGASVFPSRCLA